MKAKIMMIAVLFGAVALTACKKDECHACHYELNEVEVEIGAKCGDDLKDAEKNGITVDGQHYDVHCHEH